MTVDLNLINVACAVIYVVLKVISVISPATTGALHLMDFFPDLYNSGMKVMLFDPPLYKSKAAVYYLRSQLVNVIPKVVDVKPKVITSALTLYKSISKVIYFNSEVIKSEMKVITFKMHLIHFKAAFIKYGLA